MKNNRKTAMACLMLLAGSAYAQDTIELDIVKNESLDNTHKILTASPAIHSNDIDVIKSMLQQKLTISQTPKYENHVLEANAHKPQVQGMGEATKAISSDSWQVVRVMAVMSEDYPTWDITSTNGSRTAENHGGNWLIAATLEKAFQPLYGYVGVEAKFRYWNATELVNERTDVSDNIYTSNIRYWLVERTFTSGEFKFEANYANSTGTVRLHRKLDIR